MYSARFLTPQVNTQGLVAHWKLWDGFAAYEVGNQVFDYSLNGNQGSTTMIDYGSYPGYLFVDGSEILCDSSASIDNIFDGGGSFSGWLKPLDQGQNNGGRVFDKSINISVGVVLYCNASDTVLTFVQVTDGTDGIWTFPVDMTNGAWQHIVLTYDADATTNNPLAYVNGESVVVTETSTPDDVRTTDAAADMYIGTRSAGGRSWNGKMDDLMFFGKILSATEVKSIFSITRQRYGI
jgi:hypothetical protein